jgi:hypothetical protein
LNGVAPSCGVEARGPMGDSLQELCAVAAA